MNSFDKDLLHVAKMKIEAKENGTIGAETLREYDSFIKAEFNPPEEVIKYIIQEPINIAFEIEDRAKVASTLNDISEVIGSFNLQAVLLLYDYLKRSKLVSSVKQINEARELFETHFDNIFIDTFLARARLIAEFSVEANAKIREFSDKLKMEAEKYDETRLKIGWNIRDVKL